MLRSGCCCVSCSIFNEALFLHFALAENPSSPDAAASSAQGYPFYFFSFSVFQPLFFVSPTFISIIRKTMTSLSAKYPPLRQRLTRSGSVFIRSPAVFQVFVVVSSFADLLRLRLVLLFGQPHPSHGTDRYLLYMVFNIF